MQKKATVVPKKVAPKKVVKKASVKKVAPKKVAAKKTIVYADNTHSFWVNDGQVLNSLIALQDALLSMQESVFKHHVSKDKHDFADWVDSVLCDSTCAADLRKTKAPTSARTVVVKHLKSYDV